MLASGLQGRPLSQLSSNVGLIALKGATRGSLLCRFSTSRFVAEQQKTRPGKPSSAQQKTKAKSRVWQAVTAAPSKLQYRFEGIAPLADGACLLTAGQIQILATVTIADSQQFVPRRQHFKSPLQVEHRERWAATQRVPFGFQKREGGTDKEKYIAALIKQALAPMLPPDFRQAVEVTTTTLSSVDGIVPTDLAINAASMALCCSNLPLITPIAAVAVSDGAQGGPTLLYAATQTGAIMLQSQGGEIFEEALIEGCHAAHALVKEHLAAHQKQLASKEHSSETALPIVPTVDPAAMRQILERGKPLVLPVLEDNTQPSHTVFARLAQAKIELQDNLQHSGFFRTAAMRIPGSGCVSPLDLDLGWIQLVSACIREMAYLRGERVGGRGLVNHRSWAASLSPLYGPHGSASCILGATQVFSSVTVSSPSKRDSDLFSSSNVNVIHSSLNTAEEQADFRAEKEAEIIASEFTEAAIEPIIPKKNRFPFTLRVNSEVCSQDGCEAEVAISSAALALSDAGVPLTGPIAGMAVGLLSPLRDTSESNGSTAKASEGWEYLVDPQALEETACLAILRTAGTTKSLTVASLEVVESELPLSALTEAIQKAKPARDSLLTTLAAELGQKSNRSGPRFGQADVPRELMGKLIGSGGSTLKGIEESTSSRIYIDDADNVHFYAPSAEQFKQVEDAIGEITGHGIKAGQKYQVKVVRIQDYGAFVQLPNGFQALLHISELEKTRVRRVEDVLQMGQELEVICLGKDPRGQIKLSRKALL